MITSTRQFLAYKVAQRHAAESALTAKPTSDPLDTGHALVESGDLKPEKESQQPANNGAVEFAVFVAAAKDIPKWAGVRRVGEVPQGVQRILKNTRVRSIKRFLKANPKNIIPTGVVLAFDPAHNGTGGARFQSLSPDVEQCLQGADKTHGMPEQVELGILSFNFHEAEETDGPIEEHLKPAFVVDGQHRIFGMAEVDEDLPVIVVALIDASHQEQAFQFVVINNKAAKVPTDNVKAIISDIDVKELEERLLDAGVNFGDVPAALRDIDTRTDSPFHHLLDWPLNPTSNKLVKLTTIEACLRTIRNEFRDVAEDEEASREIFIAIWTAIKERYPGLWQINSQFMSKVGINALNDFLVDRLEIRLEEGLIDIFDLEMVKEQTKGILGNVPAQFWEGRWGEKLQDNAFYRDLIKGDLKTILQNRRGGSGKPWYDGLQLMNDESEYGPSTSE